MTKFRLFAAGLLVVGSGLFFLPAISGTAPSAAAPDNPMPLALTGVPQGEVILTISQSQDGKTTLMQLDMAMLQALPKTSFMTKTMWTEGLQRFDGVDLKTLMDAIGAQGGILAATAINDYRIEIPLSEIEAGGPMIAYSMNSAPMPVRDKGPLWIVYPYDSDPKYQSEVVFSRSIWQLNRLDILR